MCEPLAPIDELKSLKFAIASLAKYGHEPGSYEKENAKNIGAGIECRLDWVIRQLAAANEGQKNMGA